MAIVKGASETVAGTAKARPSKLFIGGLTRNTTTKALREHFCKYGRVLDCVAMRQPDGRPRGFGYVTLDSASAAEQCLSEPQVLDGRVVDMKRAVPGSWPSPSKAVPIQSLPKQQQHTPISSALSKATRAVHNATTSHGMFSPFVAPPGAWAAAAQGCAVASVGAPGWPQAAAAPAFRTDVLDAFDVLRSSVVAGQSAGLAGNLTRPPSTKGYGNCNGLGVFSDDGNSPICTPLDTPQKVELPLRSVHQPVVLSEITNTVGNAALGDLQLQGPMKAPLPSPIGSSARLFAGAENTSTLLSQADVRCGSCRPSLTVLDENLETNGEYEQPKGNTVDDSIVEAVRQNLMSSLFKGLSSPPNQAGSALPPGLLCKPPPGLDIPLHNSVSVEGAGSGICE